MIIKLNLILIVCFVINQYQLLFWSSNYNTIRFSMSKIQQGDETFLRDVGPYWPDSITQLLQICRLHIHDVNLPFHHIPKMLYWIEIWWLWRSLE